MDAVTVSVYVMAFEFSNSQSSALMLRPADTSAAFPAIPFQTNRNVLYTDRVFLVEDHSTFYPVLIRSDH